MLSLKDMPQSSRHPSISGDNGVCLASCKSTEV